MSLLWHEHRKGRITTSLFGQVCHTSIENPSKSLVNTFIKQPLIHSPALTWVLKMKIQLSRNTTNWFQQSTLMSLSRIGLYINPSYPHLDASPDALIECECCGKGLVEMKCPYSICSDDPNTSRKSFYLVDTPMASSLIRKAIAIIKYKVSCGCMWPSILWLRLLDTSGHVYPANKTWWPFFFKNWRAGSIWSVSEWFCFCYERWHF